jgi:hypothetical protein
MTEINYDNQETESATVKVTDIINRAAALVVGYDEEFGDGEISRESHTLLLNSAVEMVEFAMRGPEATSQERDREYLLFFLRRIGNS